MSEKDFENLPIIEMAFTPEDFGEADHFIIYSSGGTPCYKVTKESARIGVIKAKSRRFYELNQQIHQLSVERDAIQEEYGDEVIRRYFDQLEENLQTYLRKHDLAK